MTNDELTRLRAVQAEAREAAGSAASEPARRWHWLGLADHFTEELYLEDAEWGRPQPPSPVRS